MTAENFNIASLFQPGNTAETRRKDSAVSDATGQLKSFKGFGQATTFPEPAPQPTKITFIPHHGSTCPSLFPRQKTFTLISQNDDETCIATSEDEKTWRISVAESLSDMDGRRFTFEQLAIDGEEVEVLFFRCSIIVDQGEERRRSSGHRRRSSAVPYTTYSLPFSPK